MSKKLIFIILFFVTLFLVKGQSIPDNAIQTIEGDTMQLSQYKGKKLLIIVLPISHILEDSLILLSIDSAYNQYKDSIVFIGVPSYEDGFADSTIEEIRNWYRDTMHLSFPIMTGMYTNKSSGSQQSIIFRWLTDEALNGHFGTDTNTKGQKFLLNQNGELKAVIDPATRLNNTLMDILVWMWNNELEK